MISTDTNDNQSNTIAASNKSVNFKQKKSNDGVKRKSKNKTPISIDVPDHLSYNSVGILDRGAMSPNSISSSLTLTSRLALEAEIRGDPDSVSLERVIGLGIHCFQEGRQTVLRIRNLKLIRIGALLLEWVCNAGGVIPLSEQLKLATAHYEIWITSGMEVDSYHLKRARELFTVCVQWIPNVGADVIILLTYSKILHFSGQNEKALNILEQILNKLNYDSKEVKDIALQVTILMGVIKKSTGAHQEAYELFFSAFDSEESQHCHLLKSDLLLIMARCFQESNMSCREFSEEEVEDKYYTAFSAIEDNEVNCDSFDTWINSCHTWRAIGDKCRVLGYFSLAADMYGQGLVRDENAYQYPRLWIGYAKTCVRCGRYSDAQLAVKQAISADPDNINTFSILQKLLKPSSRFVPLANGPITDILDMLPRYEHKRNLAAARLQAFLRGVNVRRLLRTGPRQPFQAHCTILVHGKYSILVRAESDLLGGVRHLQLYDTLMNVTGDDTGTIPLNGYFSPPMLLNPTSGASTTLELTSRREIVQQEVLIYNQDTNQEESVIREVEQIIVKLTYSGRNPEEAVSLEVRLSFVNEFGLAPCISEELSRPGSPDHRENLKTSILDFLVVDEKNTIKSNIVNCVVAKGVYRYEGHLFAYAVRNIEMYTIITLSESLCCRRLELRFVREYFGISVHVPLVLKTIFRMIEVQPYLAAVLLGIEIEEQRARCGVYVENKLLLLDTVIDDAGAIVNVQSVNQLPVLTARLEVIPSIVTEKIRIAVSLDLKHLVKRAKAVVFYREKTCAQLRLIGRRMKAFVELSETARTHRRNQVFHRLRHLATYSEAKLWLLRQAVIAKETIKFRETQAAIRSAQHYLKTEAGIAKSFLELKERATAAVGFLSSQDTAIHDLRLRGRLAQCYCYLHAAARHAIFHCHREETYESLCCQAHSAKVVVRRQEVYNSLCVTADDAKAVVKREELRVAQAAVVKHLHTIAKQVFAYEELVAFGKEARRTVPAVALHHIDGDDATYLTSVLYSSAMLVVSFAGKIGMEQALVTLEEMRIAKYNEDVDRLAGETVLLLQDQLIEAAIQVAVEPDVLLRSAVSHSLASDLAGEVVGTGVVAEQGRRWGILQDTSQSSVASVLQVSVDIISELILRITREIAEATAASCLDESTNHETQRIIALSEEIYQQYMEEAVDESLLRSSTTVLLQERQEAEEERNRVEMSLEEIRQQEFEEELKACLLALEKVKKENEYKLEQEARERQENELGELAALVTVGGQRRPHSHNSVKPKMLVPQGSGKMRTAMFLAHQNKRMDAVDYLIDRAGTAVVFVTRRSAFEFLSHRAEVAKTILRQAADEPETDSLDAKRPSKVDLKREASRRRNGVKDVPSPTHLTRSPSKRKLSLTSKYNPGMTHRQDSSIGLREVFSDLPSLAPRDSDSSHSSSKSPGRHPLPTDPLESAEMLRELLATQSPASLSAYEIFGGLDSGLPSYASDSYLFPPNSIYTATVLPPPKVATTKRNPVQFLANTEIRHADRSSYSSSIDSFKRKGYSNGECEYMETWQKRLEKCMEDFQPTLRLDRALSKLQHFHSEPISRSEALCAIAEADGCVEEAIGRLHDMDFMDEIRLVCSVLPVQQMVEDIGTNSEAESDLADSTADSPVAAGDQKKLFQKRSGVRGPKAKPAGLRGSPSLPNIALSETSPAVLKRATVFSLRNSSVSASMSVIPPASGSATTTERGDRPGAFLPDIPNHTPEMRKSTGRLPAPSKSHKPSIYLERAIDNKIADTSTLVVMSRRDATLAKMEETLSRSGKYKKMKPTRNRKAIAVGGKFYNDQS